MKSLPLVNSRYEQVVHIFRKRFQTCPSHRSINIFLNFLLYFKLRDLDKFLICTLETRVHVTFYILTKEYTVPGNQDAHDKLNQIQQISWKENIVYQDQCLLTLPWVSRKGTFLEFINIVSHLINVIKGTNAFKPFYLYTLQSQAFTLDHIKNALYKEARLSST